MKRRVVPEKWRTGNWDLPPLILRTGSVLIGNESREKTARAIRIQIARRKGLHLAPDAVGMTADYDDTIRDSVRSMKALNKIPILSIFRRSFTFQ